MDIQTQPLLAEDPDAWDELLDAIVAGEAPDAPDLVAALMDSPEAPRRDFAYWVNFAQRRLEASDKHFTIGGPLKKFRMWFGEQALAGMDRQAPRAWPIRQMLIHRVASDDGGLADATELFEDMELSGAMPEELGEVALLIVTGAFTCRDYVLARRHAMRAMKLFAEVGDDAGVNFAQRRLAAAMLYTGELNMAVTIFGKALAVRGPMFGGGGVQVFTSAPDPKTEAIDEARDVSAWADSSTPEWVRAVGGLAERWDDEEQAALLWGTFDALLEQMMGAPNIFDEIEVVARQSAQRGLFDVTERALRRYIEDFPDDDWATQYLRDIGRAKKMG